MRLEAKKESNVSAALQYFADASVLRDLQILLDRFIKEADFVQYGSDADENSGRSGTDIPAIKFNWTSISGKDNSVWAAADGTFKFSAGGKEFSAAVRITLVLEYRDRRWFIVQSHYSLPAAGQFDQNSR